MKFYLKTTQLAYLRRSDQNLHYRLRLILLHSRLCVPVCCDLTFNRSFVFALIAEKLNILANLCEMKVIIIQ